MMFTRHSASHFNFSSYKFIEASEEKIMKRLFGYALMLALAAAPAMAAKNSQSINLSQNVKVGTTDIPAGDVKVTWTGTGDAVQVTLVANGKSITVPAKLVAEKNGHKGYIVNNKSGVDELETIQLNDLTLQLQSPASSGQ
jgi:hypothetical protein